VVPTCVCCCGAFVAHVRGKHTLLRDWVDARAFARGTLILRVAHPHGLAEAGTTGAGAERTHLRQVTLAKRHRLTERSFV
jgi:hypothetical protein